MTLDLPCIRLTTSTVRSSRYLLNNPATRTCILADLGITRSTRVLVEHDSQGCVSIHRLFPSGAVVDTRNNIEDNDGFVALPSNPIQPASTFHQRLFTGNLSPRGAYGPQGSSSASPVLTLRELCFNRLMKSIQVICRFEMGAYCSDHFSPDNLNRLRVLSKQLALASLPVQLCGEIIDKLRRNYQLNA
ncbi:unnamed protein product, partial [Rodentolepis nana]|uniref:THAP-type domain-containing protein n=1 Tax=Rodentolepis nana TaxID=102285 RepID=A0A0R3TI11_RODNA